MIKDSRKQWCVTQKQKQRLKDYTVLEQRWSLQEMWQAVCPYPQSRTGCVTQLSYIASSKCCVDRIQSAGTQPADLLHNASLSSLRRPTLYLLHSIPGTASTVVADKIIAHSNLHFIGYILMNDNIIYKFNSVNTNCGKTGEIKG